ncbi:hypothetical protein GKZ68_16760 [Hymenobacter sp. BRD128]|uniref:hypothetical protein n=1 Tax=Hymenobacter sp. BRD128 TaxID=2675878 RepID=UPI0015677085|nr:hypothetical protein [Hymenobacter sp. BRD128]QKG58131.1 hypothetical protein GKZ68_16760 [Hymenobacter sp. BRD128]
MKQLVLVASLWLLAAGPAALAASLALADTVAGQTQLARSLAGEACQQLAAGPSTATLSPVQAQAAFEQVLSQTIEKRVATIRQVAAQAKVAGAYEQLRAYLPTAVAVQLIRACPAATQLYNRFRQTAAGEDEFIKAWGDELCQRLAALQTAGAFKGKSSAERVELFHQEFNASLIRRGPQIMQLYGPNGNSQPVIERLAGRVTEDMQQNCLSTLMLLKDTK